MPRSDDPDCDVTSRAGVTDGVPIFVSVFHTQPDIERDTHLDAVHGARTVQQSFAGAKADPNPDPTISQSIAAATTTTKPDTNAGSVALPRLMLVSR